MNDANWIPFVTAWFALAVPAGAVDYPGPPPGSARATCSNADATFQNDAIAMRWTFTDGRLKPDHLSDKQTSRRLSFADNECFYLVLGRTPAPATRTLSASELKLAGPPALKRLEPKPDAVRLADRFGGWELSARLMATAPGFEVLWRATLRDGANYIRQEVIMRTPREPIELVEVVLLEMRVPQAVVAGRVDGSPVVSETMFLRRGTSGFDQHCPRRGHRALQLSLSQRRDVGGAVDAQFGCGGLSPRPAPARLPALPGTRAGTSVSPLPAITTTANRSAWLTGKWSG